MSIMRSKQQPRPSYRWLNKNENGKSFTIFFQIYYNILFLIDANIFQFLLNFVFQRMKFLSKLLEIFHFSTLIWISNFDNIFSYSINWKDYYYNESIHMKSSYLFSFKKQRNQMNDFLNVINNCWLVRFVFFLKTMRSVSNKKKLY